MERSNGLPVPFTGGLNTAEVLPVTQATTPERTAHAQDTETPRLPPNSGKSWTDLENKLLATWISEGTPLEAIARALGRTPETCRQRLRELGHLDTR